MTDKSPDPPRNRVEFKGEAKVNVHSYKMQQGSTYRITAKADGFVPQVGIQGQSVGLIGAPATLPASNSPTAYAPAVNLGPGTSQLFFIPPATKEYRIQVDAAPGFELGKGPLHYSLTIERANFRPRLAATDPKLDLAEHSRKLEQGKVYSITVTGRGFAPDVQIVDGTQPVVTGFNGRWFGFGPDSECVNTLIFAPSRTAEYRVVVGVGPIVEKRGAPLTFTTQIAELKVQLYAKDRLTSQDPRYPRRGSPHRIHTVQLEAGKTYQIDMMSQSFDAYLYLEDAAGNLLAEDDGGQGRNGRIVFRPTKTGTYRVVATTYHRGLPQFGVGGYDFTLTVAENPNAQPRLAGPATPTAPAAELPNP